MATMGRWALAGLALTLLGGCDQARDRLNPPELHVDQAYVRLAANPDQPSALYFTVKGGPRATRLVDIVTPSALRSEMHESVRENGMVAMRALGHVDIPAKGTVRFAPGGKHVMVWGVSQAAITAGRFPVTYVFQNGDNILFDAAIIRADGSRVAAVATSASAPSTADAGSAATNKDATSAKAHAEH